MPYAEYEFYTRTKSSSVMTVDRFNCLMREVSRIMDIHTTGIDNVKKLRVAYPNDELDAEAVKLCACKLIDILDQIDATENNAFAVDDSGVKKVVSSVSSGTETISYSIVNKSTVADRVLSGEINKKDLYRQTINEYLSGVSDANGVNLLYMGRYPYVL